MMQDKLIGALVGLARATDGNEHLITPSSTAVVIQCLAATQEDAAVAELLTKIAEEKRKMVPDCFTCAAPCGRTSDYDLSGLRDGDSQVNALKSLLLMSIRTAAAYTARRGSYDKNAELFFYKALVAIGMDGFGLEDIKPIVEEAAQMCHACLISA